MEILELSKINKHANVILDADDLTAMINVFYYIYKDESIPKGVKFYKLYDKIMMVSDLVKYGCIDGFRLEKMIQCRNTIDEIENGD